MARLLTLTLIISLIPCLGMAHPYVWADYNVKVTGNSEAITELHLEFTLDSMYSVIVTSEVIMNNTERGLQEKTLQAAGADLFSQNPVQLFLSANGQQSVQYPLSLTDSNRTSDGKYHVAVPILATARTLSFTIYDPTYYVSVALQDLPSSVKTIGPLTCASKRVTIASTIWGALRADQVDCSINKAANGAAEK